MTRSATRRSNRAYSSGWPAYATFVCAGLFAVVSLYWAVGGTWGLESVGGTIEQAAREQDPVMVVLLYAVTVVKALGAVFALALVRPWGTVFPRRLLLILGWAGAAVLVLYGGALTGGQLLIKIGVISGTSQMDMTAFHGHLYLWDPWFLVWGLLFGISLIRFARDSR